MLPAQLQAPERAARVAEVLCRRRHKSHIVPGAMSGALGTKQGLTVTSAKKEGMWQVYWISESDCNLPNSRFEIKSDSILSFLNL